MKLAHDKFRFESRNPDRQRERRRWTDHELRDLALIPVACASCDLDLAEVPFGSEVRCPSCGAWVRAGTVNLGMVG